MKKILIKLSAIVSVFVLMLPLFASAQPSDVPTGGNVIPTFWGLNIVQGTSTMEMTRPATIFGLPVQAGKNYMTLNNNSAANCDNPATVVVENNYQCPVVINASNFFGGMLTGTFYAGGGFMGGAGARTAGGLTIYTTGGGLTVDTNNGGGITIRDDSGAGGLNVASFTGGIENNSLKTKGWNDGSPVRIVDPNGLTVNGPASIAGHLRAPTIGGFGWKGITKQTAAPGQKLTMTQTCPFDGSIAVSCNFRTTSHIVLMGNPICLSSTNTSNPLKLVSLNREAQWAGYSAGTCTLRLENVGGTTVCGEIELQCWNPNE